MAHVVITIKPDGKTTIEADGWTGPTCTTLTEPYRRALGRDTSNTVKPEYFQTEQRQEVKQ